MKATSIIAIASFLALSLISVAEERAYIVEAGTYVYFPSPWFVHQTCDRATGCDYGLNGVITIDVDSNHLQIIDSEFQLSGPYADNPPLEHLTNEFASEHLPGIMLSRDRDPDAPYSGRYDVTLDRLGMTLEGGIDLRLADGDGHRFEFYSRRTWFGDSNMDLEFDSSDLVAVFEAGLFEDGIENNATWSTGDWNGNGDFESSDLVLAFSEGGYDAGTQQRLNVVKAVHEPTSSSFLWPLLIIVTFAKRKFGNPFRTIASRRVETSQVPQALHR